MEQNTLHLSSPKGWQQWLRLYRLYVTAFPRTERKPFAVISKLYHSGKNDLWCLECSGKFLVFASMVNGEHNVLLDYFAVEKRLRGNGIGAEALEKLKDKYPQQGFFVEIESQWEPGEDREIRQKRRQFYLRSGMKPMHVMADVFGVKMELLGWNCCLDFKGYHCFYHDSLSPWAAEHVKALPYPERS